MPLFCCCWWCCCCYGWNRPNQKRMPATKRTRTKKNKLLKFRSLPVSHHFPYSRAQQSHKEQAFTHCKLSREWYRAFHKHTSLTSVAAFRRQRIKNLLEPPPCFFLSGFFFFAFLEQSLKTSFHRGHHYRTHTIFVSKLRVKQRIWMWCGGHKKKHEKEKESTRMNFRFNKKRRQWKRNASKRIRMYTCHLTIT